MRRTGGSQIEHLYKQALEMNERQRTEFLCEACAGDDAARTVLDDTEERG